MELIEYRTIIEAEMKLEVDCVGYPNKKFPDHMISSWEYVKNISKRKKRYNVRLFGLYMN